MLGYIDDIYNKNILLCSFLFKPFWLCHEFLYNIVICQTTDKNTAIA